MAAVGDIVHYLSFGTPGGEYGQECRAAVVTEVDAEDGNSRVGLCVLNPTGQFFNQHVPHSNRAQANGGTWHQIEHEQARPA